MEYMLKSKMVFDKNTSFLNIFSLYVLYLETEIAEEIHIFRLFRWRKGITQVDRDVLLYKLLHIGINGHI